MTSKQNKKKLIARFSRLLGHGEANKRMLENDVYCMDVIHQNLAVISALHKINEELLSNHLDTCVRQAMKSDDAKKQQKVIGEILEIYQKIKR